MLHLSKFIVQNKMTLTWTQNKHLIISMLKKSEVENVREFILKKPKPKGTNSVALDKKVLYGPKKATKMKATKRG